MKPTLKNLVINLIGRTAQANHPITPANPDPHFVIIESKIERNIVFVRGKNTMWFGESLVNVFN